MEYDDEIPTPMIQTNDSHKYTNQNPDFAPDVIFCEVTFHQEYSAGGERRGKNRNIIFENIRLYGRHRPSFRFAGYNEDAKTSDISIKNFYYNEKKVSNIDYSMVCNKYSENIVIE